MINVYLNFFFFIIITTLLFFFSILLAPKDTQKTYMFIGFPNQLNFRNQYEHLKIRYVLQFVYLYYMH